MNWRPIS